MIPGATGEFVYVTLVGHVVHWLTALLVLGFFLLLPRFGAHRRLLTAWVAAWSALVASTLQLALSSLGFLVGRNLIPPDLGVLLDLVLLPARFLFLLFVVVAAVQASGRSIRQSTLQALVVGVTVLGLFLGTTDHYNRTNQILVLLLPALFLGLALLILAAADRRTSSGKTYLAVAMGIFAAGTSLFALAPTSGFERLVGMDVAARLVAADSFGSALMVAVLGAAVVVLVVQDSLLLVEQTRGSQVREAGEAEDRLRRIIESAGEAIVTFDTEKHVVLANAAAGRLFRVPSRSLVGRPLSGLLDVMGPLERSDSSGVTGGMRVGRRPDATTFPAEITVGAFTEAASASGGVAIIRDLTVQEQERAERERFERQVAESEKMLAIGRVVSGVAHELNNPLMVVLSQSEQLGFVRHDAETESGIRMIKEQALRARHIVRDLLAFVRPAPRVPAPMDLVELAEDMTAVQAPRAGGRGCQIVLRVPTERVVVLADRLGMEQVVTNLIENAVDATGAGGTVTVAVVSHGTNGELTVEDSGGGVEVQHLDQIFEPFFTTKGVGQGTGLGLPVSRGLVEQVGGTMRLENRPAQGIGARFVVSFPLTDPLTLVSPVPEQEQAAAGMPQVVRGPDGAVLPVVIIDDQPAVRRTMRAIFERWQWPVVVLESSPEALTFLTSPDVGPHSAAVIVCDLRMPILSGQELFRQVAATMPELAERFVFVTGDVVEPETAAFLTEVGQPVVEKPFTFEELSRAVQEITQPGRVSRN